MSIPQLLSSALSNHSLLDTASCDLPERSRYTKSLWQALKHPLEKHRLNKKVKAEVLSFFRNQCHYNDTKEDQAAFKKVWKQIGAKIWNPRSELKVGTVRALEKAFKEKSIYHGPGIPAPTAPKSDADKVVQDVIQSMLHCGSVSTKDILTRKTLKAILVKNDPEMMRHFRIELQRELDSLAQNLPTNPKEEVMWRAFLGSTLSLLPFAYPTNADTMTIPILKDGECKHTEFKIEVIPLHSSNGPSPMHALGLTPKNGETEPNLLIYLGTTFPGGDGFVTTLFADFTPGRSVGENEYDFNHDKIDDWLKGKKSIHAIGVSLGGALTFHTLRNHPELERVDAFVPPGLYPKLWKKQEISKTCSINIYCQPKDIVSHLGAWPVGDNVSLYSIIPHQTGVKPGPLHAHLHTYTGANNISIIKKMPADENKLFSRKLLTWAHKWLGPILIYAPLKFTVWIHRQSTSVANFAKKIFKPKKTNPL